MRWLLAILTIGCGTSFTEAWPTVMPPDDPNYTVTTKAWLMIGDGLTPADPSWPSSVKGPATTVDVWLDGARYGSLAKQTDGTFAADLAVPSPGDHTAVFFADKKQVAARTVHVSAALYAVVSTDWDDSDNKDLYLANVDMLRQAHPKLVMTQFFGPYVLTDPMNTAERTQINLDWIKKQRDTYGDEIGVHIHPYCNFVTTVLGSTGCRTMPSTVYPNGDDTGYTTEFAGYTTDEQTKLLQGAADLLEANGLGRPTSFRAGGWTADLTTIEALANAGYDVDSSAFPAETIQDAWAGYVLASWNLANWMGITETSQPYFPSKTKLVSGDPAPAWTQVLEVPDNGCLVDYMTSDQMISVLNMNFPNGAALADPTVFQIGFHPPDFTAEPAPWDFEQRMDRALTEVEKHLYADGNGPIRYARLTDLTKIWVPTK